MGFLKGENHHRSLDTKGVKGGKYNRRESLYDKYAKREALTKWVADFTGVRLLCSLMGVKVGTLQNKSI